MTNTAKQVTQIDPETGNVVAVHESIIGAARAAGVTSGAIRLAAMRERPCAGYVWRIEDAPAGTTREHRSTTPVPVVRSGGGLPERTFHSVGAAARWLRDNGHPKAQATNLLTGHTRYGYQWRRAAPPAPRPQADPDLRARLLREGMGLTAEWLAEHQGVTVKTIYARERSVPTPDDALEDLHDLKRRFDREVRRLAAEARETGVIAVPEGDGDGMPAAWHRMACARAVDLVPDARAVPQNDKEEGK